VTSTLPPIHAHSLIEGLNSQRSLSIPAPDSESVASPDPPRSQKLPFLAVHASREIE
jgi:hypothetical protein